MKWHNVAENDFPEDGERVLVFYRNRENKNTNYAISPFERVYDIDGTIIAYDFKYCSYDNEVLFWVKIDEPPVPLAPCPFCGATNVTKQTIINTYFCCPTCDAQVTFQTKGVKDTEDAAIEKYNTREEFY